jgi:ketosteroid isomerase-like protein
MTTEELLRDMYAGFNARDIDAVLSVMSEDVDWPNVWEGGRLRGHEEVRDYWTRQWAAIDPRVEPVEIEEHADGRAHVRVHQTVRDLEGGLLSDGVVMHVYDLRDGLVARMDVQ